MSKLCKITQNAISSCTCSLVDDVSCFRCETTYYCEGDGDMKPCGRCEDSSATCDRDPTEYSFGLASECSPCPDGWVGTVDTDI